MEYLQQLATEWYEYKGYFVHRDLWVGIQSDGSYECELDIVAFHPTHRHLLHIEPSLDLLSWKEKQEHFQPKFDAGRKYLHRMFGNEPRIHLEQIALISANEDVPRTIAGARVIRLSDLIKELLTALSAFPISEWLVPEQWPLLRTLQFVAAFRDQLLPLDKASGQPDPGAA